MRDGDTAAGEVVELQVVCIASASEALTGRRDVPADRLSGMTNEEWLPARPKTTTPTNQQQTIQRQCMHVGQAPFSNRPLVCARF